MTKQRKLREAAQDAHSAFITHDAHCPQCSETSRYGAAWKSHLCPIGLSLFYADTAATKAEGQEGKR